MHQRNGTIYVLSQRGAKVANPIHEHSRCLGHVPIIAPHPRRGTKQLSQCPKAFPPHFTPELTPAQKIRFGEHTMVERVYTRWKDEFGATQIRVMGAKKVLGHLSFALLAVPLEVRSPLGYSRRGGKQDLLELPCLASGEMTGQGRRRTPHRKQMPASSPSRPRPESG